MYLNQIGNQEWLVYGDSFNKMVYSFSVINGKQYLHLVIGTHSEQ